MTKRRFVQFLSVSVTLLSTTALNAHADCPATGGGAPTVTPSLQTVLQQTSQLPITNHIPITGGADWIGIGFNSVWVKTSSSVLRINPTTNQVDTTIHEATCRGFATSSTTLWTTDCGSGALLAIDPATNQVAARVPVTLSGNSEGSIAVTEGTADQRGVWIVSGARDGTLTRVDPVTRKVVANITIPNDSNGVVASGGYIWVTNTSDGTVTQIDPAHNSIVRTIRVHGSPRFIAAGEGAVWSLNQADGSVSRIDPATGTVTATIDVGVPGGGGDIKVGEGGVWVTAFGTPVSRIDPATNRITHQYTGSAGDALNVGYGSVWLPAHGPNGPEIWRISASQVASQTGPTGLLGASH